MSDHTFFQIKKPGQNRYAILNVMGMGFQAGRYGALAFNSQEKADLTCTDFPGCEVEKVFIVDAEIIMGRLESIWNYEVDLGMRRYLVTGYNKAHAFAKSFGGGSVIASTTEGVFAIPLILYP